MIDKVKPRTFTVKDLYTEAAKLVRQELKGLKSDGPLTSDEETKSDLLAKKLSQMVLKEMKLV